MGILYKKYQNSGVVSSVVNTPGAQIAGGFETAEIQAERQRQSLGQAASQPMGVPAANIPSIGLQTPTTVANTPPPPPKSNTPSSGAASYAAAAAPTQAQTDGSNQALIGATQKGAVAGAAGMGAVTGFAEGFSKSGLVGGITQGIGGLVTGLFNAKGAKDAAQAQIDSGIEERLDQEKAIATEMRGAERGYNARKTSKYMQQADAMYDSYGKQIGVARKGTRVEFPITAARIKKACKGAKVTLEPAKDNTMICSKSACQLVHKSDSPFHQPLFRRGGSIVNKKKRNIIPHGTLHEEENDTGINGDKGIPIVKNGEKIFELERSEWVLNAEVANEVTRLVYDYLGEPSDDKLINIGRIVRRELLLGTYSYDDEYAHLNH